MASDKPTQNAPAPERDNGKRNVALLIIDVINCFDFPGAEKLKANAKTIIAPLLALRDEMDARNLPVVYVNDNFGEWHSDRDRLVRQAIASGSVISKRLAPRDDDYFVIKPQFSGFYSTNLSVLLPKLGVSRVILAGLATDICILFTAADAHMRDYEIWVPSDLVTAQHKTRDKWALTIMREQVGTEIAPTSQMTLDDWLATMD